MKQLNSTFSKILIFLFIFSINPVYPHEQSLTNIDEASLGKTDFPISCSKDVQLQFNKGLALLHNMMYMQSEKEFTAVAKQEPTCAMAYWGIAMTLFHPLWAPPSSEDLERGWKAVQKAARLMPPTKREMSYIRAVTGFYKDWNTIDHPTRISTWEKLQEEVFKENPEDIDAAALYALAHLATASKGDKTYSHQKKAGALIEDIRSKAPRHPGMFHYIIHAYDNPMLASRALDAAKEYDKIAQDAPHAQHMPSHIFVRLGLWTLSTEWNIRSATSAKKQSKSGELSLHYIHAMDYLIYAYLQKAQDKKAQDILDTVNKVQRFQDSFISAYGIAAVQARYFLELKEWEKAATLKPRSHTTFPWDKYPWYEAITYFTRGLGAAHSNDIDTAQDSIKTLDTFYELTKQAKENYWAVLVDSQRKTVAAWIAYSKGNTDKALALMKKAADIEDSVDKHPVTPGAVLPARELLGDMLVRLGKYHEAMDAYEASLLTSPNRFNSLNGAGYAAQKAGDLKKAKFYYEKLIVLTSDADSNRPSLKNAKVFLKNKD